MWSVADDLAGELEARDIGRSTGRSGISTGALHEVSPIEGRAVHADEDFPVSGNWSGALLKLEDIWSTGGGNDGGAHEGWELHGREDRPFYASVSFVYRSVL